MSRPFREKNKDLVKLEVVSAKEVWTKNKKGKPVLRKDINIYGRIEKGFSSYVTSTNMKGSTHKFVENFSSLNKKTKNAIVNKFNNEKKKVVYLIKK